MKKTVLSLSDLAVAKKRVFLRADLNVPLKGKTIVHDYRLRAILPTIDQIQQRGGKVILATHIGRPQALSRTNYFDENLSTKILIPWFTQHNYEVDYEIDLMQAIEKSKKDFAKILLLENLRFFNGEKQTNDDFAKLLAQCADLYVNDAFALLHRADTSVTLLPEQFTPENRALGPLIEKEQTALLKLKKNPKQPFVIVLGGNKIHTKMAMLENLLEQPDETRVHTVLIGGVIANTFLAAQQKSISHVDEQDLVLAHRFLEQAKQYNVTILLPIDIRLAQKPPQSPQVCDVNKIPKDGTIIDIGPKTVELFNQTIAQAKTIFANGTMGIYEKPDFEMGSREVLRAIAQAHAYSVIGGGDAVAAAYQFECTEKISFLSTGGGATLAFLASKNPEEDLPALRAMQ